MVEPIRIAAALIEDDIGRVLLVRKRGTAAFMQAGGKIENGETAFEALARGFTPGGELEETLWVVPEAALSLELAPLTRDCVLPLAGRRDL